MPPDRPFFRTALDRRLFGLRRRGACVEALLAYEAFHEHAPDEMTPEAAAFFVETCAEGLLPIAPMVGLDFLRGLIGLPSIIKEYVDGSEA